MKAILSEDKRSINVSWDRSSFNDIGAFFVYKVTATPITTRRRQSAVPIVKIVPHDESSVTLTRPDPNVGYEITVGYVISDQNGQDIDGPTSIITIGMSIHCVQYKLLQLPTLSKGKGSNVG